MSYSKLSSHNFSRNKAVDKNICYPITPQYSKFSNVNHQHDNLYRPFMFLKCSGGGLIFKSFNPTALKMREVDSVFDYMV